jgi:hypothetical protein
MEYKVLVVWESENMRIQNCVRGASSDPLVAFLSAAAPTLHSAPICDGDILAGFSPSPYRLFHPCSIMSSLVTRLVDVVSRSTSSFSACKTPKSLPRFDFLPRQGSFFYL